MDAVRLLDLLQPHLDACGAQWMLAGGFALAAWGSARATAALDLVVDDSVKASLLSRLTEGGFETLFDSEGFTNLLHPDPALGRLDLIWVEGETSRKLFAASVERPGPGGRPTRVPRPEHLVAMKVRAIQGRPSRALRDAPDLAFLLSLPGIDEDEAVSRSYAPVSSSSGKGSHVDPGNLDLGELPIATGADAEALERARPGPMSLDEYARFVVGFPWTSEQLRAIPTAEGLPRFTLDG